MKTHKYGLLILLGCQAVLLSGCTGMLWERERFARCHWPAKPPGLRLFYSESAQDILAEYDEATEGTVARQRRAYWVDRNTPRLLAGRRPWFDSVTNAHDLVVVPIADNPASPPASSYHGLYAVVSTNGQSFILYPGDKPPTAYSLPVYYAAPGQRVKQVILTPFAVAVDATLVGAVVCVIAAGHAGGDWLESESDKYYFPPQRSTR